MEESEARRQRALQAIYGEVSGDMEGLTRAELQAIILEPFKNVPHTAGSIVLSRSRY